MMRARMAAHWDMTGRRLEFCSLEFSLPGEHAEAHTQAWKYLAAFEWVLPAHEVTQSPFRQHVFVTCNHESLLFSWSLSDFSK